VKDIPVHVVGESGYTDLHLFPAQANDPGEQLPLALLPGEHMLNGGTDLFAVAIVSAIVSGIGFPFGLRL
jgi:hypothetical protein